MRKLVYFATKNVPKKKTKKQKTATFNCFSAYISNDNQAQQKVMGRKEMKKRPSNGYYKSVWTVQGQVHSTTRLVDQTLLKNERVCHMDVYATGILPSVEVHDSSTNKFIR